MSSRNRLTVWLNDLRLGVLEQRRGRLSFTYSADALDTHPLNTPLLSVSMPTRYETYGDAQAGPFFEGLLPEGRSRDVIAFDLKLNPLDTFTLLHHLGRDCAGALSILDDDEEPESRVIVPTSEPLDDGAIAKALADLPEVPLGADWIHKVTLAGQQDKLLLTRRADGAWLRPGPGLASTHILKPALSGFPASVANEAFSLRLAARLGLPTAAAEVMSFGVNDVLVVERFDRTRDHEGRPHRIHQEDMAQVLALRIPHGQLRTRKYQQWGGPSLKDVARVLDRWATTADLENLLRLVTVNALLGNSDNHAKNIALLHHGPSNIGLAPAYDLMATALYPRPGDIPEITLGGVRYGAAAVDRVPGMFVNGQHDVDAITSADLIAEATTWGLRPEQATRVVSDVVGRTEAALPEMAAALPNTPPELLDMLEQRAQRLRAQMTL